MPNPEDAGYCHLNYCILKKRKYQLQEESKRKGLKMAPGNISRQERENLKIDVLNNEYIHVRHLRNKTAMLVLTPFTQ
jgi:hypothetical protein